MNPDVIELRKTLSNLLQEAGAAYDFDIETPLLQQARAVLIELLPQENTEALRALCRAALADVAFTRTGWARNVLRDLFGDYIEEKS